MKRYALAAKGAPWSTIAAATSGTEVKRAERVAGSERALDDLELVELARAGE